MSLTTDSVSSVTDSPPHECPAQSPPYHALKQYEARLLHLYPGEERDALRGEFTTFITGKSPTYTALSYCWGDSGPTGTILVTGVQVPITGNLDSFLRHLRSKEETLPLWIDSLCINQSDVHEKNQQVNHMDRIYEYANIVKVWLGNGSPHSSLGIQILAYFAEHRRPAKHAPWQTLPPELVSQSLGDIMNRPWWHRMWVVQEVALSQNTQLICGTSSISWDSKDSTHVREFQRMIKYAAIHPDWRLRRLTDIEMQPLLELLDLQIGQNLDRSFGSSHRRAPDILDVAYDLKHRLSSDPRDMVFALQGIARYMMSGEELQPNYLWTVEQTYDHLESVIQW